MSTHNLCFDENYQCFLSKKFQFFLFVFCFFFFGGGWGGGWGLKFSIYLKRRVFVMFCSLY